MRSMIKRMAVATAGAAVLVGAGVSTATATASPAAAPLTTGTSMSAAPSSTPSPSKGATSATVMVRTGPFGPYLTDGQGRSLYRFAADTGSTSTCFGPCAQAWPPQPATGTPSAGPGVTASKLGVTNRSDGVKQVTYAGHPLYRYAGDSAPGQTNGQGLNVNGGLWWLVSPDGNNITGKPTATPTSHTTSGSPSPHATPSAQTTRSGY